LEYAQLFLKAITTITNSFEIYSSKPTSGLNEKDLMILNDSKKSKEKREDEEKERKKRRLNGIRNIIRNII
jgi:hypothetical protein